MSREIKLKNFWISWYHEKNQFSPFELSSPWWITGEGQGSDSICAAIEAEDEIAAKESIYRCYDETPESIQFRFCEERPEHWSPFNDRFRKEKWMQW
jgi:hypothetical protein